VTACSGGAACTCECCTGIETRTPAAIFNRSGLSAIAYRVGTHGDFLASMLARLSSSDYPALGGLRTRETNDYSIGLLDAFACAADVLTFYQERLANESYLRTAAERRSLVELARLTNYRLRPGVAAETWVAFTMDEAEGSPSQLVLDPGIQLQSVPGPNETPQTFETVERIDARPVWNAVRPRMSAPYLPEFNRDDVYFDGIDLNVRSGDGVLFVGDEVIRDGAREEWDFRIVLEVGVDTASRRTHAVLARPLGSRVPRVMPARNPQAFVFRRKASVYGHNAPRWQTMPEPFKTAYHTGTPVPTEWPGFTISPSANAVDLDVVYQQVVAGSWLVLSIPTYVELYRVRAATETSRDEFALSGKVTRAALRDPENYSLFADKVRQTTVYIASEALRFAEAPIVTPVSGTSLVVDRRIEGWVAGRKLLVSGSEQATGAPVSEVVTVARVDPEGALSRVHFAESLQHTYRRSTVVVHGNTARATHGETVNQILGSGDGSRPHQAFTLKQIPLTFLAAETESGAASSIEVRVNDIAWRETPTLFDATQSDREYVVRIGDSAEATVQFGDGNRGARLPTGRENVRAKYRKGIGAAGNLKSGTLSQLMTRPLGLKAAVNPAPAEGGTDAEDASAARRNMPLGVRALGRTVSLRDYEDFARAFTGIAKAQASVLPLKAGRTVVITVGGEGGAQPTAGGPTLTRLIAALKKSGDPLVRFEVRSYQPVFFRLGLKIKRDPAYLPDLVAAAIDAALRSAFSFEARDFGRPVALSEVVAVAQQVPGVVAVDVDRFYRGTTPKREERLLAAGARVAANGSALPAELLLLTNAPLDSLGEMP
jgi:predicted phage baseplate assembly protein